MTTTILLLVFGGALLILGAELLVRGASSLAMAAGISPLAIGLTVVAFGTSSPEMAVTVGAAWADQADMALGNVVGSNIFNVLLILGLSAVVAPLVVSREIVRRDVPLMIAASLLVLVFALNGVIGRLEGLLLFAGVIAYTTLLIRSARSGTLEAPIQIAGVEAVEAPAEPTLPKPTAKWPLHVALIVVGLIMLVAGAQWLVTAAIDIATALGVSELVIGLTIVAAGTSLPEVATSVLASVRGERDIAVGNIIGSNLFNILAVLGLGAIVAPAGIEVPLGALTFDIPVMIAVAVAALPIFFTGTIARWHGGVFLAYYVAYTVYLILDATDHPSLDEFATAMIWFVLPLTALTLAVVATRAFLVRRNT